MNASSVSERAGMVESALFSVELLSQDAETDLSPGDPLSWGTMRLVMAGVEIWNDAANLTSTALCLLRTTRGDFAGPIGGVSDTNPLIHHCGLLPEMGCPIGASWRVRHLDGEVHIDLAVRASEVAADEAIAELATPVIIERAVYSDQIRAFAIAVRDGLTREPGRYVATPDPGLAPVFDAFWAEFTMLLSSDELIATELTAPAIEEAFASSGEPVIEAVAGFYLIDVCDPEQSAAIVSRAEHASWNGATINADRSIDRAIRDAEVLDERANAALTEELRDLLFIATRGLAAELVPGAVLAEVQIVRYHPGGHYLDHRDTPALGTTPRVLSLVWYLNDGFTGGETRFVNPDIIVSPVSGVAIAFSPVLMHRAEPIATGVKYAVVAWYHEIPVTLSVRRD
jgi:predicted 2-oxoglutarate/Fe(II)-dependent dioxygenase YbiX